MFPKACVELAITIIEYGEAPAVGVLEVVGSRGKKWPCGMVDWGLIWEGSNTTVVAMMLVAARVIVAADPKWWNNYWKVAEDGSQSRVCQKRPRSQR